MSDQTLLGLFGLIATMFGSYMSLMQAKIRANQQDTNKILDANNGILTEIRLIVLGRELNLLKTTCDALGRLAELEPTEDNVLSASVARKAFAERSRTWLQGEPGPGGPGH
jgi:hypothetical protein